MSPGDDKQQRGGDLCVHTPFGKSSGNTPCLPDTWSKVIPNAFLPSELQKSVAVGLWQTGYYAEWLWCGQDGGGEARSSSSRGLLLALGWLLSAGALEKLLTQRVQQLDRTLLSPAQVRSNMLNPSVKLFLYTFGWVSLPLSLSGAPSTAQQNARRYRLSEKTSVAHRPSEIPGTEPVVHAGRACPASSCCK